jgi:hypothetical protein
MGDENCIQKLGLKTWMERALGRCRRKWENNIKVDLRETGLKSVE